MFRLVAAIISVVVLLALTAGVLVSPAEATSSRLEIGAFFPDPQFPNDQLPSIDDLHSFEAAIGRQTDVFLWYESIGEDFYADTFRPMAEEGRTIQLAWEPHDFSLDANNQPAYRLKNITAGNFDNDIRRWARELRDFGYPIYFRPMCEMNGDWVSWGGNANGNSPQDYIPAWRHVHDIFVQEGADNVMWVWSPNRDGSTSAAQATFNTYYPGDAYVDYVGINGYNWGTLYNTPQWTSSWQSFEEVIRYSYDVAVANTNKPIVICETATTEVGGNAQNGGKAQWITDAFNILPSRFPRVAMLTWFNVNKETDWRVESSTASLDAFRAAVRGSATHAPALSLGSATSFWSDYADYIARQLSVSYTLSNSAGIDAVSVQIVSVTNTNGVILSSTLPMSVGDIAVTGSTQIRLLYTVPPGVTSFRSAPRVTARDTYGNNYSYPSSSA
ncbi:MAG: glycoside hydrolase family 26 protein [Thermoleophilia bacterium]